MGQLDIDWKDNKIDLPKIVVIKLQDQIKVRRLMNRKPLLFHLMLKQEITSEHGCFSFCFYMY